MELLVKQETKDFPGIRVLQGILGHLELMVNRAVKELLVPLDPVVH